MGFGNLFPQRRFRVATNTFGSNTCGVPAPNLGPPVVPVYTFFGEGSPTKIDCSKKSTLILTSLLDLGLHGSLAGFVSNCNGLNKATQPHAHINIDVLADEACRRDECPTGPMTWFVFC